MNARAQVLAALAVLGACTVEEPRRPRVPLLNWGNGDVADDLDEIEGRVRHVELAQASNPLLRLDSAALLAAGGAALYLAVLLARERSWRRRVLRAVADEPAPDS